MSWRDRLAFLCSRRIQTCAVRGQTIRIDASTYLEFIRARTYATKEPDTLGWIDRYGGPGTVLYDVGANIGLYSLYAAVREPHMQVVAFEPWDKNRAALWRNQQLNGRSFPCVPVAVSDHDGRGTLQMRGVARGQTGTFVPGHGEIQSVTLDTYVRLSLAPHPTMLKIDVDGHEEAVLRGARQTLADPRLDTVLIEIEGDVPHRRITAQMQQAGLHPVSVSDWTVRSRAGLPVRNYVFAR